MDEQGRAVGMSWALRTGCGKARRLSPSVEGEARPGVLGASREWENKAACVSGNTEEREFTEGWGG